MNIQPGDTVVVTSPHTAGGAPTSSYYPIPVGTELTVDSIAGQVARVTYEGNDSRVIDLSCLTKKEEHMTTTPAPYNPDLARPLGVRLDGRTRGDRVRVTMLSSPTEGVAPAWFDGEVKIHNIDRNDPVLTFYVVPPETDIENGRPVGGRWVADVEPAAAEPAVPDFEVGDRVFIANPAGIWVEPRGGDIGYVDPRVFGKVGTATEVLPEAVTVVLAAIRQVIHPHYLTKLGVEEFQEGDRVRLVDVYHDDGSPNRNYGDLVDQEAVVTDVVTIDGEVLLRTSGDSALGQHHGAIFARRFIKVEPETQVSTEPEAEVEAEVEALARQIDELRETFEERQREIARRAMESAISSGEEDSVRYTLEEIGLAGYIQSRTVDGTATVAVTFTVPVEFDRRTQEGGYTSPEEFLRDSLTGAAVYFDHEVDEGPVNFNIDEVQFEED